MSYTCNLISRLIDYAVPFSEKLIGENAPQVQQKLGSNAQKRRLNFAREVLRNASNQSAKLKAAAKKILEEEKGRQAESSLNQQSYISTQLKKLATPIDYLAPGAGILMSMAVNAGDVISVQQYGSQEGYTSKTFLKRTASVVFAIGSLIATPIVSPLIAPFVTIHTVGAAAGGALMSTLTLDVMSACRRKQVADNIAE